MPLSLPLLLSVSLSVDIYIYIYNSGVRALVVLPFVITLFSQLSLSKQPPLYDIMGGSLKFRLAILVAVLRISSRF